MDGFHFELDLKRIAGCFQGQNIRQRLHRAVNQDNRKKADGIMQEMMGKAEDERGQERAGELYGRPGEPPAFGAVQQEPHGLEQGRAWEAEHGEDLRQKQWKAGSHHL